jgi:prophage regulatory protein
VAVKSTFALSDPKKDSVMQTYLTLNELRAKLGNRSRSAIYLDLAAGRLPHPVKLGGRLYWPEGDVEAHLRNMREQVV